MIFLKSKEFKNIFTKPLATDNKRLYNTNILKILRKKEMFSIHKPLLSACEYRTPFIGSDNQSWLKGSCVGV
jgi:hypothetical protein